jgi:peptide/nickel transport system substrate-binding protein
VTADETGDLLKRLVSGEIDVVERVRPEDHAELERADQLGKVHAYDLGPGLVADGLWISPSPKASANKEWFAKDEFRLAISTAIDRRAFCNAVYLGACDPIWGPVTPGNPSWFDPDLPATRPDPPLARGMLASLGLADTNHDGILDDAEGRPVRITMLTLKGSTRHGLATRFLQDELRRVGVDVEIVPLDRDGLEGRRTRGDYDAIYDRFAPRDTDPAMSLDFWRSWPSTDWGRRLAELMRTQSSTFDRVQRVQLFADAEKLYVQHMPVIFLGAAYQYVATMANVMNVKPSRGRLAVLWSADGIAVAR